ncbi:hypothetical protein CDL15_Pgr023704 [Punica granatum]|uniref:Uncharacterized protein n=1 Tax=Punica granatum TaxID=22663 RepID=A0A218XMQ7_PUNGR|nr:hypothetical protein CDL15_Pgr023704 [Punica granatum]
MKSGRVGSDRTGPPEEETARKSAGPDWVRWAERTGRVGPAKKELGRGPLTERAAGIGGSGGDGAAGGGSRPRTTR